MNTEKRKKSKWSLARLILILALVVVGFTAICSGKDRVRSTIKRLNHSGMYNTGNYLGDLHRHKHRQKMKKANVRFFLRYKMHNKKNYRPARSKAKSRARYIVRRRR